MSTPTVLATACSDAQTCSNQVWEEEQDNVPWPERKVHHVVLLGQGGSGKTHVVQHIVAKVVDFIWPPEHVEDSKLLIVAFSNAQAKNISFANHRVRTS